MTDQQNVNDEIRRMYGREPVTVIARVLGMSKNAVIGRANRLGLAGQYYAHETTAEVLSIAAAAKKRVSSDSGLSGCRWIDGDPHEKYSYCGAPRLSGSSYCAKHHAIVWIPG